MIIDNIILHDFGVYAGHHKIDLAPPAPDKPVILFGGLNGSGKTTMLDALLLCLFGPVAQCSNRNGLSYQDYLRRCINKRSQWQQASVGLQFRHHANGEQACYRLRRTWEATKTGVREEFEVHKNEQPAPFEAKNWLQQIEEIMPAKIAHLFFFDGEQAERYASAEDSSELIKTAIHNLLGLDIVARLDKDLRTLERKTQLENVAQDAQQEIDGAEKQIASLRSRISAMRLERASLQTHSIDRLNRQLREAENKFRNEGGELYERKTQIEAVHKLAQEKLAACTGSLRELAAGCLPLSLIDGLLSRLQQRDRREQKVLEAQKTAAAMQARDAALVDHLQQRSVAAATVALVRKFADADLKKRSRLAAGSIKNEIDEPTRHALASLRSEKFAQEAKAAHELVEEYKRLQAQCSDAALELASVPDKAAIKAALDNRDSLLAKIAAATKQHETLSGEIDQAEREVARLDASLQSELQAAAAQRIEQQETVRMLSHSSKARTTLAKFRHDVIRRHIKTIEALVLESYQSLLRKSSLIAEIAINPDDFSIGLFDPEHRRIPPERLSAGERQLLAISLLWGMAKASGRPLPMAIDTPLGRLDAAHRTHLVERYFPFASHQVVLFSTDQELHGPYLEKIKPRVGRHYRLDFDDRGGCTSVAEGYLLS